MSPNPANPAVEPLPLRLLRSLLCIGLSLSLTAISILFMIGALPAFYEALQQVIQMGSHGPRVAVAVAVLVMLFLPLGLTIWAARRRWLTWPVLLAGTVVIVPVLAWLAWDDPAVRQPVTIEEFSPAFPGAEESFAVLMQYSKLTPSAEAKAFYVRKAQFLVLETPHNPEKWLAYVTANRAKIEHEWEAVAPQRRWQDELAKFDWIGDLTPSDYSANLITFGVWRSLSKLTCAKATLLALDGKGEDAIALLAQQLGVSRRLQRSSRTLVRTMIAVVVERMDLETLAVVMQKTPLSAANKSRLEAALGRDDSGPMARRLLMTEYVLFAPQLLRLKLGDFVAQSERSLAWLRHPLNFVSALFLNPIATMNLYGDRSRALAELAEQRKLGEVAVQSQDFSDRPFRKVGFKNVGGRLMLGMITPVYTKVLESYWQTADLRQALRAKLAAN